MLRMNIVYKMVDSKVNELKDADSEVVKRSIADKVEAMARIAELKTSVDDLLVPGARVEEKEVFQDLVEEYQDKYDCDAQVKWTEDGAHVTWVQDGHTLELIAEPFINEYDHIKFTWSYAKNGKELGRQTGWVIRNFFENVSMPEADAEVSESAEEVSVKDAEAKQGLEPAETTKA